MEEEACEGVNALSNILQAAVGFSHVKKEGQGLDQRFLNHVLQHLRTVHRNASVAA